MSTLVYLCHFGSSRHSDLLIAAVKTLRDVGKYQGDIMIYSDSPEEAQAIIKKLPGNDRIGLSTNSGNRGLFTRYSAAYFLSRDYGSLYDNFIYIDNDVIVSKDINNFIDDLEKSTHPITCYADKYYQRYDMSNAREFNALTVAYPKNYKGRLLIASPSIFAFKSTKENTDMFLRLRNIRDTVDQYRYDLNYDTALFSYLLYTRLNVIDYTTVDPLVYVKTGKPNKQEDVKTDQLFTRFSDYPSISTKLLAIYQFIGELSKVGDTNVD